METDDELPRAIIEQAFAGSPEHAVDVSIELLQLLASALSSTIGDQGFELLLIRVVRRVTRDYPWLQVDVQTRGADPEFELLRLCFLKQDSMRVRAASIQLFNTLMEILSSLVGAHLTTLIVTNALARVHSKKITKELHDE